MTATPRIYTESSKRGLAERGIDVVDMEDQAVYGPELHHLASRKPSNTGCCPTTG